MKLSQGIIDWIIERRDRMRNPSNIYRYMWVHWWHNLRSVFDWLLQQLVASGAFENIGKHYKLKDVNILYHFKKRSDI